jgi:tyrosyl-tRNA synthetase
VFNSNGSTYEGLEFGKLLTQYTANRLLEREDFTLKGGTRRNRYLCRSSLSDPARNDSVMLHADVELGGTDQIFNLSGRTRPAK